MDDEAGTNLNQESDDLRSARERAEDRAPAAHGNGDGSEPFFPNFLFKEALAALVAFVLLLLIVVYVKIPTEPVADPTDTSYVPRPEWYFLFVFQMLKYFPGKWEPVATTFIPLGFILVLLALPFIDARPRLSTRPRPLATVSATFAIAVVVLLTLQAVQSTPAPAELGVEGTRQLTPTQTEGQQLYKALKCSSCHSIDGVGGNTGPDLGQVGTRHDAQWLHTFLEDPKAVNPNTVMQSYLGRLTHHEIENLAQFLAALR
jgi:ubiquinol-cytochrome c reductase cytochrome b subunit